jgi:acyl-CoA dehydrogenase
MNSGEKWFGMGARELALQEEAQALATAVADIAAEADALSVIHPGMRDALQKSGLAALMVPAAYGGRNDDVDPLAVCLVREVLMQASSHLDSMFALQGIGSPRWRRWRRSPRSR